MTTHPGLDKDQELTGTEVAVLVLCRLKWLDKGILKCKDLLINDPGLGAIWSICHFSWACCVSNITWAEKSDQRQFS